MSSGTGSVLISSNASEKEKLTTKKKKRKKKNEKKNLTSRMKLDMPFLDRIPTSRWFNAFDTRVYHTMDLLLYARRAQCDTSIYLF